MKTKLTIADLPESTVERMRQAIREDKKMVELEKRHTNLIRAQRYMDAFRIKRMMNEIEEKVINMYLAEYEGQTESMYNFMQEMNDEDRDEMNILVNSIIMLCDMIDTFTLDCNELLKKYHPDYRIEMFDKVIDYGKAVKEQMDFMAKNTDMVYQCAFADDADKITELVKNKVKSFVRKLKRKRA